MNRKKEWAGILLGYAGALLGLYGVVLFNQNVMMTLPLGVRMAAGIVTYWAPVLVPAGIMLFSKDRLTDYGFEKAHIFRQILVGIGIGVAFSAVFTLIPHLLGLGSWVDSGKRYQYGWQFAYEFGYCIFAVGLAEEFLFRGFFYGKLRRLTNTAWAVIGSSVLFGLFHLFGGNGIQMLLTCLLGVIWCLCRNQIKHCSTLSLIVAHGVYDALITVFASALLG